MEKIVINDIEIEIYKKKIKNLRLSVSPPHGRVRVSAPLHMSQDTIQRFVLTKIPWIQKHRDRFKNLPCRPEHKYRSGESIYLWGKRYMLEVLHSNVRNDIRLEGDRLILQVREASTLKQRENVLNSWYRRQIKREIPLLLEKWQRIIGVNASDWGVKNMKTRWGTCNVKDKRIWLNLQLAKRHPQFLEYVVVHELVHLLERNHSKAFAAHMDTFLPDWRGIRDELNGKGDNK